MRGSTYLVFILVAMAFFVSPVASSAAATPAPTLDTLSFTPKDVAALLRAMKDVNTSQDIELDVESKSADAMPEYDKIAHYAGLVTTDGHKVGHVWIDPKALQPLTPEGSVALRGALMLAVMDYGFAGQFWKTVYDTAYRQDDALPSYEPDRSRNRHRVIAAVIRAIDDQQRAGAPSP